MNAAQKISLKNGLSIYLDQRPYRHSCAVGFWLHHGSRFDCKTQAGFAHLLEHMLLFDLESHWPLDWLNGETGREISCLQAIVAPEVAPSMVQYFARRLQACEQWQNSDFIREQSSLIAETKSLDAFWLAEDRLFQLAFSGQGLGRSLYAYDFSSITLEDFQTYAKDVLCAPRIAITVVGNFAPADVWRACEDFQTYPHGLKAPIFPQSFQGNPKPEPLVAALLPLPVQPAWEHLQTLMGLEILRYKLLMSHAYHGVARFDHFSDVSTFFFWMPQQNEAISAIMQNITNDDLRLLKIRLQHHLRLDADDLLWASSRYARDNFFPNHTAHRQALLETMQTATLASIRQAFIRAWQNRCVL